MRLEYIRLTMLGAITGLGSGVVVLAFRWVVEVTQKGFLPHGILGNYEALPPLAILGLPLGGGLILGLLFDRMPAELRSVGIVHVIQQLRFTGRPKLPLANAFVQFCAGAFAIICGHSVDREGPGVHLGAACGSLLGGLSKDADAFTLTAAGAAAAIAAAFNTPLAGVVFVIEVLGVRYRVDRFIPVITASVMGALISRAAYGATPSFSVSHLEMGTLYELLPVALLGVTTGLLAVAFIGLAEGVGRFTEKWRPSLAFTLAGLVTGLIGLAYPQVLGVSYDTLDGILNNHLEGVMLIGLVLGKLIATAISIGLRVPGGLIGPSLVIGGALGGVIGMLVQNLMLFESGSESFYASVGMIAMMSALLQAPLAAMFALLELTADPNIIFPGMTAVVCADLIVRQACGKESVFEHMRRLVDRKEA
ncbi:MAG: chloride channel protein [Chromatiales bacterium]